ncbi:MAG: YceI family protein [Mariniphaga sp.]
MKSFKLNFLLISALTIALMANARAQEYFKLQSDNSKLVIEGTSSIHDWEMEADDFRAETLLKIDENSISEISKIEFKTPVSGLKSGKGIMDNKAHDALKKKKYPEIKFGLNNSSKVNISGSNATLTGLLTIAGKSKEVNLTADLEVENQEKFLVSGSVPVKMSDFGIEPPTAMMGAMKTGDEVVVKFNLEFQKSDHEISGNF